MSGIFGTAKEVITGAKKAAGYVKDAGGVGKAIKNLKATDTDFNNTKGKLYLIFGHTTGNEKKYVVDAINKNKIAGKDVPNQKVGDTYKTEFKRLYDFVIDVLKNMGRADLATEWQKAVPKDSWNEKNHPIDFLATLLKGAGTTKAVDAQQTKYTVLVPYVPTMVESLKAKGINIPTIKGKTLSATAAKKVGMSELPDIEGVAQLFYNNFVAQKSNYNYENFEPIDFTVLHPGHHLDEAVVDSVVSYVKSLQDQKNAGKVLPKTLDKIAASANNVQESLTKKAKQTVAGEIGGKVMSNASIIIIASVAVVILLTVLIARR